MFIRNVRSNPGYRSILSFVQILPSGLKYSASKLQFFAFLPFLGIFNQIIRNPRRSWGQVRGIYNSCGQLPSRITVNISGSARPVTMKAI